MYVKHNWRKFTLWISITSYGINSFFYYTHISKHIKKSIIYE